MLIMALAACSQSTETLPYYEDASFTPHWLSADSTENFHTIAPFSLTDQDGQSVTGESLKGKVYVADFFFSTCPGICPKMTSSMSIAQDSFLSNNDIKLISFSVTPNTDSVEVLKAYAERYGVQSGKWHLLTGDRNLIYGLGRKSYFVEEDLGIEKTNEDFLHTENFVLIDRDGHIRGIYNGLNRSSISQLIKDAKLLLTL